MTGTCQACQTGRLTKDEYATTAVYEHYRCQNPDCRAGGIKHTQTGHTLGPVFEGYTPLAASIASQPTTAAVPTTNENFHL